MGPHLCAYEAERDKRIAANNIKLQMLGVTRLAEAMKASSRPTKSKGTKRPRSEALVERREPSARIRNQPAPTYRDEVQLPPAERVAWSRRQSESVGGGKAGWNGHVCSLAASQEAQQEAERRAAGLGERAFALRLMPSHTSNGFWLCVPHTLRRQMRQGLRIQLRLRCSDVAARPAGGFRHAGVRTQTDCGPLPPDEWHVTWLPRDNDAGLSGGWRGFALDHALTPNDSIVLHMDPRARPEQPVALLIVHIFRGMNHEAVSNRIPLRKQHNEESFPRKKAHVRTSPSGSRRAGVLQPPAKKARTADASTGCPQAVVRYVRNPTSASTAGCGGAPLSCPGDDACAHPEGSSRACLPASPAKWRPAHHSATVCPQPIGPRPASDPPQPLGLPALTPKKAGAPVAPSTPCTHPTNVPVLSSPKAPHARPRCSPLQARGLPPLMAKTPASGRNPSAATHDLKHVPALHGTSMTHPTTPHGPPSSPALPHPRALPALVHKPAGKAGATPRASLCNGAGPSHPKGLPPLLPSPSRKPPARVRSAHAATVQGLPPLPSPSCIPPGHTFSAQPASVQGLRPLPSPSHRKPPSVESLPAVTPHSREPATRTHPIMSPSVQGLPLLPSPSRKNARAPAVEGLPPLTPPSRVPPASAHPVLSPSVEGLPPLPSPSRRATATPGGCEAPGGNLLGLGGALARYQLAMEEHACSGPPSKPAEAPNRPAHLSHPANDGAGGVRVPSAADACVCSEAVAVAQQGPVAPDAAEIGASGSGQDTSGAQGLSSRGVHVQTAGSRGLASVLVLDLTFSDDSSDAEDGPVAVSPSVACGAPPAAVRRVDDAAADQGEEKDAVHGGTGPGYKSRAAAGAARVEGRRLLVVADAAAAAARRRVVMRPDVCGRVKEEGPLAPALRGIPGKTPVTPYPARVLGGGQTLAHQAQNPPASHIAVVAEGWMQIDGAEGKRQLPVERPYVLQPPRGAAEKRRLPGAVGGTQAKKVYVRKAIMPIADRVFRLDHPVPCAGSSCREMVGPLPEGMLISHLRD